MTTEYFNPVQTVHGAGALSSLPRLLNGRKAVLVTFPEAKAVGLLERIEQVLGDRLAGVIDQVRPNPDVAELAPLWETFWRDHADTGVLVAVGGGSAIDTAKALMVGNDSGRFADMVAGLSGERPFSPTRFKQLIAVPTTAGTGSEVTPWATVWDRERQKKYSLHLPQTWPSHAVIDPELMLSLPSAVTLQSGLDALSHALESIWNVNANPVSDVFAVAAIHETLEVLPLLMQHPLDLSLRSRMALAALKAGLAFSNTKTALAHSISYEMTLRYGIPHGIACSFSLPMVLERAMGRSADRDRVLEQALGKPLANAPRRLEAFIEALGVRTRFSDYGVSDDEARDMVLHAQAGARGRNFIGTASELAA
ncbi:MULTISPECIES: iron-containing alcohol dehydrogenase PsrA [unclassified Variovorax]|uniref:iron-containing alcohol dehydrogenase PsrA n=1 Tax=unclassified Variovorax TaxID=663243 RepID=UPI001BD65C9A|nr:MULTISPECIES: iron-containing alcohol dehydrogenase PsrA [unclassified Variovorax]